MRRNRSSRLGRLVRTHPWRTSCSTSHACVRRPDPAPARSWWPSTDAAPAASPPLRTGSPRSSAGPWSSTPTTSRGITGSSTGTGCSWRGSSAPCRAATTWPSGRPPGSNAAARERSRCLPLAVVLLVEGVGSSRASPRPVARRVRLGPVRRRRGVPTRHRARRPARPDARRGGRPLGRVDGRGGAVPRGGPALEACRHHRPAGRPTRRSDGLLVSRARAGPGPRAQQRW
jgi:hypothetical protein